MVRTVSFIIMLAFSFLLIAPVFGAPIVGDIYLHTDLMQATILTLCFAFVGSIITDLINS